MSFKSEKGFVLFYIYNREIKVKENVMLQEKKFFVLLFYLKGFN